MNNHLLWQQLLAELSARLEILEDKPEETIESTLKALWFAACGQPKSAEAVVDLDIPNINENQVKRLGKMVKQRLSGIPLPHITGRQQFMDVELLAGPEALVPRKETEILGEAALDLLQKLIKTKNKIILVDVCTGAGNLVVSLAKKNLSVKAYASDLSKDAVALAKRNVAFHQLEERVEVRQGDLLAPFDLVEFYNQVDLLLCNPPYISSGRVAEMHDEISKYEPRLAFDGGPFGVKILNSLLKNAPQFLKDDGWLAFEVGLGQGEGMVKRMKKKYSVVQNAVDKNGEIRVIIAQV